MTSNTPARDRLVEAGLDQTAWGLRIASAEERGGFTDEDATSARGWTTCACGEIQADIPRYGSGAPKDDRLFGLGMRFSGAVDNNDYLRAATTLIDIEHRADKVARESK